MKFKLSLQWKLTLSFILIIAFVVLLVYFLSNHYIIQHFEHFCEFYGRELPKCMSDKGGQRFLLAINKTLLWVGGLGLILAFVFGYFTSRFFLEPIDNIISTVKSFSQGNYDTRIKQHPSDDEMQNLSRSLNEMFANLEKSEKLRKDLTANISHELATPLTNIYGYIEALSDNIITDQKERQKTLELVKNESERLIKLTRELKSLALLESDSFHLSPEEIDINRLIENIVENFKIKTEKKGIIIQKELEPDLPLTRIDPHKFQQALSNIVNNAIQYSPSEGEIKISTRSREGNILISVKDSGKGIKKEDIPFIFERFYKSDKPRNQTEESIGIGLTIVKRIVEAHQGKIEVFSEEDQGSEFVISIPKK